VLHRLQTPHHLRRPLPTVCQRATPPHHPQTPMRNLIRPCLGCSRPVRGKPRCVDCQRVKDMAKRAKRPDLHNDHAERRRRARVVADHRAIVGDWCPGWGRQPAHQTADLTADHVREVAKGGDPRGHLVVRCRSCNAARSAHLNRQALRALQAPEQRKVLSRPRPPDPSPAERPITHRDGDDPGPVAA